MNPVGSCMRGGRGLHSLTHGQISDGPSSSGTGEVGGADWGNPPDFI